jgi:very-short-patch-repair endonuclease
MARLLVGLPTPEYQYKVFDRGGLFVAQVDFGYPSIKEAFEVDGWEAHGTPDAQAEGFERDHRLKLAGWGVTHFTWRQVVRKSRYVYGVVTSVLGAHNLVYQGSLHPERQGVTER